MNYCEKIHPRNCYYFCAYGFCKFGNDCNFRHQNPTLKHSVKKDTKLVDENRALKKEMEDINVKHENLKVQLDIMMESQARQDNNNKDIVANEIEKIKEEFIHILNVKTETINNQTKQIAKLTSEIVHLQNIKQNNLFVCENCDFKTQEKNDLLIHKQNMHENLFLNESEIEDSDDDICPTYKCDLCGFTAMYPDNVAFHYRENHGIKMTWEEAELNCLV